MTRKEIAMDYFAQGYNCCQAVVLAYQDMFDLDRLTIEKLTSSFGGGIGRMREVCGACSAMFMVAGILYGTGESFSHEDKASHYSRIQELAEKFKAQHDTMICRELLKELPVTSTPEPEKRTEKYYNARPCIRFVRTAAEILDDYINNDPPQK